MGVWFSIKPMALPLSMGEGAGGEVGISMTKEVGIKRVNKFQYCIGAKIKIGIHSGLSERFQK